MKKITLLKSLLMAGFFLFGTLSASSQLLVENFDYTIGSLLTANGWTAHSGEGTQAVDVTDGLTFAGYAGSGIGGAARLDNNGEDVHKTFTAQTGGVIYTSFLLKTDASNSAGYFYMFAQNPASSSFISRVFINATGNGIGISNNSTAPSSFVAITPGTTVLVVVKYDFASQLSYLYVLNSFSATEPGTPDQTSASTGSLSGGVGSIALRQYSASQRQIVDGIRVATTWADAVAPASSTPTVATPTFNPAAGTYTSTQNVSISTTTADASIYYTTNGDEPTESSTPYTAPVEISSTTTLKAKAYKAGMDPSGVATAVYTFPEEVADIATLRTKATGSTPYRLTGEAVLTLQTSTRNAKYIQDETGAVLIDDASGVITTAYNLGDGITGITGTLAVFREMLQFVPIADPGAATSTGNVVSPVLVELSNLGNYQAQLVKIENVTIDGTGDFTAGTSYNLNGAGNPVLRTQYGDLDYIGSPIPAGGQDIVGVVLVYDAINQFVPRSLADFAPSSGAPVPTITVSVTELTGFDYEVSTGGPSAAQQFTVSGSNLTDDLMVAAPGNFEVSLTGNYEEYNPWVEITPVDGTVEATTIYVRLFSSLTKGNYGGDVNISSVGATMKTVALSGSVFEPIALPNVIISEVYGGGGNSGATFTNDFIELYNTTNENVEIGGWSVQYFSATGTSANVFVIPDGRYIPPFTHFLIQCAGGATGIPLPDDMVDATCTLNLSGSAGKVILYNASEAQEISDINSIIDNPAFVDYVPYGTNATPVWGSPMSSNISSSTSAARRENIGFAPQARVASAFVDYIYTGNIGNDFSASSFIIPQGTGITSAVTSALQSMAVYAANGKVHFTAAAGEVVEIYNAVGQRVVNTLAVDGLNSIAVEHSGVMIVKAGNRIAKVIL